MYSDYLAHYGVKGMKWGVRHVYENKEQKKSQKKFEKLVKKRQFKNYNSAMRRLNDQMGDLNKRHEDYVKISKKDPYYMTKEGQSYIKDLSSTWKKIYMDTLKSEVGKSPIDNGYEWIKEQSAYHLFDEFVRK